MEPKRFINPLYEAEVRIEARKLYQEKGRSGVYFVVSQLVSACEIFMDVADEEQAKEKKS